MVAGLGAENSCDRRFLHGLLLLDILGFKPE